MKNFVNKHTTLLCVLSIIPSAAIISLISDIIFDYWNVTMQIIQFVSVLIQLTAITLLLKYSEQYKIHFKNPFKRLWIWVRYKRVDKYYMKLSDYDTCIEQCPIKKLSTYGYEIMIGSVPCQNCENCIEHNITEYGNNDWIKCKYLREKRSFKPLNWLKKLFAIIVISLLFISCSVYVNCNFNKVPKYKTTQQDSTNTNIQPNEYWF